MAVSSKLKLPKDKLLVELCGERRRAGKMNCTRFFYVFQVKCTAISVPKADSVVWSFAGRELNFSSNNTPFYVEKEYTGERIISTVTLLEPISTYFGEYNCTVTNSFGTDSIVIKLMTHGNYFLLFIDCTPLHGLLLSNGKRTKLYLPLISNFK